jgi:GH35 family endo-1,4-beta-xylanase
MGTLTILTTPGAKVRVKQLRHAFHFGAALCDSAFSGGGNAGDRARYLETVKQHFNAAVTENALKWHNVERTQGNADFSIADRMAAFCQENDIHLRGHCIYWGIERFVPEWVKALDDEALCQVLARRGTEVTSRYRGRIPEYDLNNEMVHGDYFRERLGAGVTADMARWAKAGDPDAILYLNDYDVLTGNRLDDYVAQIESFLEQGIPIGGIGVQGHLHADTVDPAALQNALDTLARFGLPCKVTEFNFPGQRFRIPRDQPLTAAQEEAKARALTDYYRICFAHPAVEGILMWGFWEGALWLPHSALWKRDWTPTPAAHAYRDLVLGEWWTDWEGDADEDGRCEVKAFYGRHLIVAGDKRATAALDKGQRNRTVAL